MKLTTPTRAQRGVTLIELLIVIIVVSILASIAIPSYRRYLLRAQRSDATTTLLRLQANQEKRFLQYGTYTTVTGNLTNTLAAGGLGMPSATSEQGFYAVTVAVRTTGYEARATAITGRGQWDDTTCRTFIVNETGTRQALSSTGVDNTNQCFR